MIPSLNLSLCQPKIYPPPSPTPSPPNPLLLLPTNQSLCLSLADTLLPGVGNAGPGTPASDLSGFLVRAGGKRKSRGEFGSCSWSLIAAMSNTLLRVYPSELKIPLEPRKQNSSCLELFNKTDQRVAFKVKTTNPNKYAVRPASGIVWPGGSCGIIVTMRPPKDMPPDYHCKDKFLVQSIVVEDGTAQKDIVHDMFRKAPGKVVEEFKLRVVYIPAHPPSPVPEEAEEEDNESLDSDVDHEVERPSTSNVASKHGYTSGSQSSHHEDFSVIYKSADEESRYADENQKLLEELVLLRKRLLSHAGGFSGAFVLFIFSLSFLVGYSMLGSKA